MFTLPIVSEAGATCSNPMGISPTSLDQLVQGGSIILGGFTLTRQSVSAAMEGISMDTTTEAVAGGFESYNAEAFALYTSKIMNEQYRVNPESGCLLITLPLDAAAVPVATTVAVDAGEKLVLTGPGLTNDVPRGENNLYALSLSTSTSIGGAGIPGFPSIPGLPGMGAATSVLVKGDYKLAGTGGTVVGPFEAIASLTDPITWTNKDAVTAVTRANDLNILWTGGTDADLVQVVGLARGPAPEDTTQTVNRAFTCWAKGSAGNIVVPSSILLQMPAVSGIATGENQEQITLGMLSVQQISLPVNGLFTAPLVAGGNTEPGLFGWLIGWTKTLDYQ